MAIANAGSGVLKFAASGDTTVDDRPTVVQAIVMTSGGAVSSGLLTEYGEPTNGAEYLIKSGASLSSTVCFPGGLKMHGVKLKTLSGTSALVYVVVA
jgi:hypothetical protein